MCLSLSVGGRCKPSEVQGIQLHRGIQTSSTSLSPWSSKGFDGRQWGNTHLLTEMQWTGKRKAGIALRQPSLTLRMILRSTKGIITSPSQPGGDTPVLQVADKGDQFGEGLEFLLSSLREAHILQARRFVCSFCFDVSYFIVGVRKSGPEWEKMPRWNFLRKRAVCR